MSQPNLLFLEIFREQEQIKVSAQEGALLQGQTLHHYEYKRIEWPGLYALCGELFQVLKAYNRDGRLAERSLKELKRLGGVLLDELFPPDTRELLLASKASEMVVRVDNGLVQIPWELLYDGGQFFCRRWNMGRLVRTQQKVYKSLGREISLPLRMLLVADPRGDLQAAYREGQLIRDMLDEDVGKIEAELLSSRVEPGMLKGRLKEGDILHYAGHADYIPDDPSMSGLLMKDGKLSAAEITEMSGGRGIPSLVFVNGCRSGQTEEWNARQAGSIQQIFGLANACLLAGAHHYVGTFWEVPDEPSSRFAMRFYRELASGTPVGASLRKAREGIIQDYGESAIVWATYMLYGDPAFSYVRESEQSEEGDQESPRLDEAGAQEDRTVVRGQTDEVTAERVGQLEELPDGRRPGQSGRRRAAFGISAIVVLLLLLGGTYAYNYMKDARQIASVLNSTEDTLYGKGDLENALRVYTNAIESGEATRIQLASLHGRIGRIHAASGEVEQAVEHYEKALGFDPEDRVVKSDYCLALNRLGRYQEAGNCMDGLLAMDPEDEIALAMHRQIEERLALELDEARNRRVDELVGLLTSREDAKEGEGLEAARDDWTSRPMTLAILSFEERGGLSRRAGETEALFNSLQSKLKGSHRIRVVDRLLLQRILEELELATGILADAAFSLRIGRILSARLIGHGSLYRDGESVQVNLRFIETETTSLKVALNETFERGMKIDEMAAPLADAILSEVDVNYPLRGEVVSVSPPGNAILNIGSRVGLQTESLLNVLPPGKEDPRLVLARIRVAEVEKDRATAQILSHPDLVTPGCRVLKTESTQ